MRSINDYAYYFFRGVVEKRLFAFCSELASYMHLSSFSVRSYFMYTSFLSFNSPLLINMSCEFLMQFKKHFRRKSSLVADL